MYELHIVLQYMLHRYDLNSVFLTSVEHNLKLRNNTSVFLCFMDATKAFDRVNHSKLFTILIDRNVPTYLVRLLYFWYSEQLVCVKWGEETSEYFKCTNGVRQRTFGVS